MVSDSRVPGGHPRIRAGGSPAGRDLPRVEARQVRRRQGGKTEKTLVVLFGR